MRALVELLHSIFRIRPEELRRTGLAFVYLFAAVGAFIVGRIARTVLFLEIPNYRDQLPLLYVLIAITISMTMYAYARVERRLRRDHTNALTLGVIIAVTLLFRLALPSGSHAVYWAFYLWVELFGAFLILQFWALTNDLFHARQARRLFAIIGSGGVLANVAVGFGISGSVKALGTENLLFVACALLAISLLMVLLLGHAAQHDLGAAHERGPVAPMTNSGRRVFESRYVRLLATVVVLVYVVSTLVDYQFQVVVGDSIPGKDDRSAFFGTFFGVTGVLAAFVQLFVTSRLLERFGVLAALLLLPAAMTAGSAGLLLTPLVPGLWTAAATKGAENVFRYTVNDSTLQIFYLPLPAHIRGGVKTWIDGILKPLAIGGAGVLMAIAVGQLDALTGVSLGFTLDVYELSWIVLAALAIWGIALVGLRREYLGTLLRTLQRRRLNFADSKLEIADEATAHTLERSLGSADVGEVLHALELVPYVQGRARAVLAEHVADLLRHRDDDVRVEALRVLAQSGAPAAPAAILALLPDTAASVRTAATLAYCVVAREQALARVRPLLDDPAPEVRAAAVAGLIRYGGLDGVLASADTLKRLLTSPLAAERRHGAWVLGEVRVQTFFQPLVPLFADPDESVRQAAITAAGHLRALELVPPLLSQLAHPRLVATAASALAAYGSGITEAVGAVIGDTTRAGGLRANACRVLARLGDDRCIEILRAHLGDLEPLVRGAAVAALTTIVHRHPVVRIDRDDLKTALRAEAQYAFELMALAEDLALDEGTALLGDALAHREKQATSRIFGLLALAYPPDTIELVSRNLHSARAATRANAVEVLENLLASEERAFIVPLADEAPPAKKLEQVAAVLPLRRRGRSERLTELLDGSDEWLRVCAAMATAAWGLAELEPNVRELLGSDSPLCRETAITALRTLADRDTLRQRLERLRADPVRAVSRYAEHVLAEIA